MKLGSEYEDKRLGPEYLELLTDLKTVINYGKYSSQVISDSPDWEGKEGETLFRYQVNGTGWYYYQYFWVNSGWSFLRWTSSGNALTVDDGSITDAMIATSGLTYSGINPASNITRCFTGTYTGDGNATKALTGVGFKPKALRIFSRTTSGDGWKTNQDGTYSWGGDANGYNYLEDGIISLDADGFTVGDGTGWADNYFNTLNRVYTIIAWG